MGLGDGGTEGSNGSKGLRLARELMLAFGGRGWSSKDMEGCVEEGFGCLWTAFFLLTCSHLFSGSSIFSFSLYFFLYIYKQNDHIHDIPCI